MRRRWLFRVSFILSVLVLTGCGQQVSQIFEHVGSSVEAPSSTAPSPASSILQGTRFPDPIPGLAVYDLADVLSASVEASLETEIDAIEARSGAEVVVYLQVDPTATEESNTVAAGALMDQWGIGQVGIDNGFVILVSFDDDRLHGRLSTWAGAGLLGPLSQETQAHLRDDVMLPAFRAGEVEEGIVLGVTFVDHAIP